MNFQTLKATSPDLMTLEELIARDEAVSQQIAQYANHWLIHSLAWLLARSGDSIFWLLVSAFLIWQKLPIGWPLLITVAVAALLTAVVKGIFKRERPEEKWAISTDIYSFPSGHSVRAGAVAITLAFAFPQYAVFCILWAGLVAIARVLLSRHYIIDVAGGLLFGVIIGFGLQFFLQYYF
jgi:membrane-associated phospholipid phosphatase